MIILIYQKKLKNTSKYNYIWILDQLNKQKYIKINFTYILLNNYFIFIKSYFLFIQCFFKYKKNKLKFINLEYINLFTISLKLIGLGYKITILTNKSFLLYIGYSHNLFINLPDNIFYNFNKENNILTLTSYNNILLTNIVYRLKYLKKIDIYKGTGFNFIFKYQN